MYLLGLFQEFRQLSNSTGTMGYGILAFWSHFCKSQTCFFYLEDGVVAKTVLATKFGYHLALHYAFEQVLLKIGIICTMAHKGYHGAKTAVAVLFAFHLGKEATDVGGSIVAVAETVHCAKACGEYSRSAIKCIYMQTCIIGEAVHPVLLCHIACLLQGVAFQSICILGNLFGAANLCQ